MNGLDYASLKKYCIELLEKVFQLKTEFLKAMLSGKFSSGKSDKILVK